MHLIYITPSMPGDGVDSALQLGLVCLLAAPLLRCLHSSMVDPVVRGHTNQLPLPCRLPKAQLFRHELALAVPHKPNLHY